MRSAARFAWQARSFPTQHATGEMLVVRKPRVLRDNRGSYRTFAGTAGKHDFLSGRVRNFIRVESRQRPHNRIRVSFHRDLVRFADVNQKISPFGNACGDVLRRKITDAMRIVSHRRTPATN